MTNLSTPNEIARETLRLLVTRKQPPTPQNYGRLYFEIAGNPDEDLGSAALEKVLHRLAAELPRSTPELARLGNALASAQASRDWDAGHHALIDFARHHSTAVSAAEWATLLRELTRLLADRSLAMPVADRQTAIEKALAENGSAELLYQKLRDLTCAWEKLPAIIGGNGPPPHADVPHGEPAAQALRELLAHALEVTLAAGLANAPELAARARALSEHLRAPAPLDIKRVRADLEALSSGLAMRAHARDSLQDGLWQLLRLLVENVGELVTDDQWLRGQLTILRQVLQEPLNLYAIEEAQRNLKDVIRQQGTLKQSLNATKSTLKEMVASFIDELGKLSTATGDYHDSIENLAQQIRQTDDVAQLTGLLEEVMRETHNMQTSVLQSRREVLRAREQVNVAEVKIRELEKQLEHTSDKALRDHLTGTLNRRGLGEAFEREIALADRTSQPLSIALLDIDNFKDLNDTLGHQAGDDALVHLAQVIQDTMRPTDSVSRFGGEEFLILLPNSDAEHGVEVISRLQRELTKRFFLHDNRKLLITFSAGIAAYTRGESQAAVIGRADRALYKAKNAGKNRVFAA